MGYRKTCKGCVNKQTIANGNWGRLAVESLRNHEEPISESVDQDNYLPTLWLLV